MQFSHEILPRTVGLWLWRRLQVACSWTGAAKSISVKEGEVA